MARAGVGAGVGEDDREAVVPGRAAEAGLHWRGLGDGARVRLGRSAVRGRRPTGRGKTRAELGRAEEKGGGGPFEV